MLTSYSKRNLWDKTFKMHVMAVHNEAYFLKNNEITNENFVITRYVAIYFSTLFMRYKAGKVTDEMLAFPKSSFIIIGFLEALGVVSGMYAGGMSTTVFS